MENKTLGQKIEYFRKRAKLSQLDLEIAIGASQGSISRIENGQINPTKETIQKISKILNLDTFEISDLFNINIDKEFSKYIEILQTVNKGKNLDDILNIITSDLIKYVDGKYSVIFLHEKEKNLLKVYSLNVQLIIRRICNEFIGYDLNDVSFDLNKKENQNKFFVKSFLESSFEEVDNVYDAAFPLLNKKLAGMAQRIAEVNLMIAFPIQYLDQRMGVLGIVLNKSSISELDRKVIKNFNDLIATVIYRFYKNGK